MSSQHTDRLNFEDDETNSFAEAKSDLSLGRKRQKRSSMNVTEDGEKHSVIWRMFMSSTLQASVFMEKNFSDNWHSIKN